MVSSYIRVINLPISKSKAVLASSMVIANETVIFLTAANLELKGILERIYKSTEVRPLQSEHGSLIAFALRKGRKPGIENWVCIRL